MLNWRGSVWVQTKCISSSQLHIMAASAFLASIQVHNFSCNKELFVLNFPFQKFLCVNKVYVISQQMKVEEMQENVY